VNVPDIQPTPQQAVELKRTRAVDERALRSLFFEARTANGFLSAPVPRELIEQAIDIAELGPTSANTQPVRYVVIESPEAKEKLRPCVGAGNLEKTMQAPATVIVAADTKFYENIPRTFPTRPEMVERFNKPEVAETTRAFARDNALLQMGYFILACRAVGLDTGAMGGFDREKTDAAFFPDGRLISLYLINVGYGDDSKSFPRLPRLPAAELARFL
jgi:3-hydroxypropanoate dehydrogenase